MSKKCCTTPADYSDVQSFNGTIFHVWKGNRPCRIYVADGQVYFIGRVVGINPGAATAIGSQFGLLGGLAVGLAGAARIKNSPGLVRDDDPTPPDKLVSKHPDNCAISASDISDPRIESKGKHVSYGPNAGRWHFTRRGESKETVVLLESPADASRAVALLGGLFGSRLRNEVGIVTSLPVPPEQADIVTAMQSLTQLLSERAPIGWKKVRCEVRRAASPDSPRPLEIFVSYGDSSGDPHPDADPNTYQAAIRLARKLSTSVKTFPGVAIEMTRLDDGSWRNNMKVMEK